MNRNVIILAVVLAVVLINSDAMAFEIRSSAFANNGAIPAKYSCDGPNISPPLAWTNPPSGVKSFALIMDDPDASLGTWVHWVVWNIPETVTSLKEGAHKLADGQVQGINDFGRAGYGGPCPPSGAHHYYFKLYALDALLDLPADAVKYSLEAAMKGHKLGQATVIGIYTSIRKSENTGPNPLISIPNCPLADLGKTYDATFASPQPIILSVTPSKGGAVKK